MEECSVTMEAAVSEIQVDNKDEKKAAEVGPQDERQKEKASVLCFKRRKKAGKVRKPKAGAEAEAEAAAARKAPRETGAADQPPRAAAGAWASIKGLVTPRGKRSEPSKPQKAPEAEVQPEIKAEGADLPKKKAKSRLKMPCIKFSRGAPKSRHSKIKEDSDRSSPRVQGEAGAPAVQTQTQARDLATEPRSTPDPSEGLALQDGAEVRGSSVSNSVLPGETVVAVDLELDNGRSAMQAGTPAPEKEAEVAEDGQSAPSQEAAAPLESPGAATQHPEASGAAAPAAAPDQQAAGKSSASTLQGEPGPEDQDSRAAVAEEEKEPKEAELSQESDLKEGEARAEQPKPEASKRMEPIAIIITDTEVSEFDVTKSKNVPKRFLISIEHEQGGFLANDSDFEGRTSEQYETLLIETASSLVKNAIQLSVEQLVNEMASDDNQINTLLQ